MGNSIDLCAGTVSQKDYIRNVIFQQSIQRIMVALAHDLQQGLGKHSAALKIIRDKVIDIFASPQHRDFTDHKPDGHSERIIAILNALCSEMMEVKERRLTAEERFILLASAYVHDIGMQYGKDPTLTLMDIRERHHLFSEEMILGSVQKPQEYPYLGIPYEYVDEIARIAKGHRRTDLRTKEYDTAWKGGKQIRLRLLAALLSLADDLDITYERVIMENLKLKPVPQESRVHWWRCHYVEGLEIEKGRIRIYFKFPSKEYGKLVAPSVENQLESDMRQLRDILWDNGVRLYLEKSRFEYSSSKKKMTEADLNFLRGSQSQILEKSRARIQQIGSVFLRKARETIGLNATYRRYKINLKRSKEIAKVLEGEVSYRAVIKNETTDEKPLFPDGKVCDGHTTIPKPLSSKLPNDPEDIASFAKLCINEKDVCFDKTIKYLNSANKEKGVRREIISHETIGPGDICTVSYLEKFLFDRMDTFTRRFRYFSHGLVEIHVRHPANISLGIFWFTSPESKLRTAKMVNSPKYTIFSADGTWVSTDGFILSWG